MAGLFSLRLDGEGGGEWTLEITPDGCRVVAGSEGSPTATLQMQAADFVSVMCGELPARAVIARGAVRLTGDAVRLMRLPQAFRLAISPGI
jgi:putative sterol carrier protein